MYGSSSHAPREPRAPSICALIARTVSRLSPYPTTRARSRPATSAPLSSDPHHLPQADADPVLVDHPLEALDDLERCPGILETRDAFGNHLLDPPVRGRAWRGLPPPLPSAAARRRLDAPAQPPSRAGVPSDFHERPSRSRRRPDWPWSGRCPESSIAFALTNDAWPLACVSTTGLTGDTVSSDSWTGNPSTFGVGTAFHFSWCQPRPTIHCPGFALSTARATIPTISSQLVVLRQVEIHLVLADSREVPVPLDEPRHREPGVQLDHLRRRSDVWRDVGLRANGDDPPVARGQRLGLRDLVVEGDDAAAAKDEVGRLLSAALPRRART